MSNAPERIWAEPGMPGYLDEPDELYTVEYVRCDMLQEIFARYSKVEADRIEELEAKLSKSEALLAKAVALANTVGTTAADFSALITSDELKGQDDE